MGSTIRSSAVTVALAGFILTGAIAVFGATLGFLRIILPVSIPLAFFWVGSYAGPIILFIATIASVLGSGRNRSSVLLAGSAIYMSFYFAAEAIGLTRLPYAFLIMLMTYGVVMVTVGLR